MAEHKGYRIGRLTRRRKARRERSQWLFLYVLAGVVAFCAVVGAWYLAQRLLHREAPVSAQDSLSLLTVGAGEKGRQAVAGLVLYDATRKGWRVYTVPRAFLLEGERGEYVMAGDIMGAEALPANLGRLVGAEVVYDVRLSYAALLKLAAGRAPVSRARVDVTLRQPVTLRVKDAWRTYEGTFSVPLADVPGLLSARGQSGEDEDGMAVALLSAVLHAAALQPAEVRGAGLDGLTPLWNEKKTRIAGRQLLGGLLDDRVAIERLPSRGVVSEGQFAFRPDHQRIMTEVTRRVPGHSSAYTVIVRNGTGEAGIGALVRDKLSVLDANLPTPSNADSFDYRRTQILAGSEALAMAEDVRAILGRGVVLRGQGLGATTLVVIVGADLNAKELQ